VSDEAQAPAPGEPRIGDVLAGYRLDEVIGRGGMAIVYRAYDERLGRNVALKVLTPRLAPDEAFRRRFVREYRIAASVDHPNIIPIFEAGDAGGLLFIAMRFVQGGDVQTLLAEQGPLPPDRASRIVTQVAAALDAAHEHGLVHRDVKPANMLRDAQAGEDQPDHIYLSDFGLSKHWLSSTTLTSQGEFLGTMDYVAPEQIEGNPVDGRTDQYALACSVFEMLSGAPPFRRDETMAIMWAQVSALPPALTSRRPGLPAAVDPVLAKALAKAPDDRYGTCLEFATALHSAIASPAGEPPASQPPASPPPAPEGRADLPLHGDAPADVVAGHARPAGTPAAMGAFAATPPAAPSEEAAAAPGGGAGQVAGPGPAGDRMPPGKPPARSRRSRAVILVACVALLGAIGGGYALFGTGSGATKAGTTKTGTTKAGTAKAGAALAAPGCTTKTATVSTLATAHGYLATVGGKPADAVVTSHGYGFVALGTALGVLQTGRPVPRLIRTIPLPEAFGVALTQDQKYLLVAGQSGLTVFRASDLEHGLSTPLGTLTSPGGRHAVQVAVSPDGKYAFVTLQLSGHVAVFNLRRALKSGFGPADLEGLVPVPPRPMGIAASPDGHYVYVASGLATPASASGQGSLTVIDTLKAERAPASSVVRVVKAGCGPDRVAISKDSRDIWVTVGGSNALVAYSAAKLLTDPRHALIARVAVGELPLGLVFFDHGNRLLVADSNRDQLAGRAANVALVNVPDALHGKPALLGTAGSGAGAGQVTLYPGGKTLLVADTGSGQVQVIKVTGLP
jgi:DNA-binding beta-propeller fold protein YncE/tRNA A-37 threonylcarbamoyl transferase component Bud32